MNIYLTGSHGTGKTTTAKIIAEKTGLSILPSASRMSPFAQGTVEHQKFVMDQVYKRCSTWSDAIHERTPFDVYSYTSVRKMDSIIAAQKMKVESFARIARLHEVPIFYFPVTFPFPGNDPERASRKEQLIVDDAIFNIIRIERVKFVAVPKATPEERADFILKELSHASL